MKDIESLINETIKEMPDLIQKRIKDVEIVIDDGIPPNPHILGLYQGVPVRRDPRRRSFYPHRIYLFIRNIKKHTPYDEQIKGLIKKVLKHEIGHHIGFSERRLSDLGY